MFVIIRVRGPIKVNKDIEHTMCLLNLTRANHCVIYPENEKIKGMINKVRGYVTYGEINNEILKKLLLKRGKVYSKEGKLNNFKDLYKDKEKEIDSIVEDLLNYKKNISDINLKPVFRLKPPSKGYDKKGIKKTFKEGGVLGYRSNKINELLKKML
jgi:large subunit ribosomal protein L30